MIARGRVKNGVVVLDEGVHLPEGREVTVVTPTDDIRQPGIQYEVSEERKKALLELIGICKTDNPPDDKEVDRIIEQERMKKYG